MSEQLGGPKAHQVGGLGLGVGLGQRELDALVLGDRSAEDDALLAVCDGPVDKPAGVADRLGCDQNALGVHAVQDVVEAAVFFADQIGLGNFQIVEKELIGLVVDHGVDLANLDRVAGPLARIDQEHAQPQGFFGALGRRGGPRQQQHHVGVLDAGDENLGPVDDVVVPVPAGKGFELGGVRAGVRLGYAKGLQADRAAGDLGQIAFFLFVAAVAQQGAP